MDVNKFRECVKGNLSEIQDRSENKEIWIYGAGAGGCAVFDVLLNAGITVKGFIDKSKRDMPYKFGLPVQTIDEIDKENIFIIIAVLDYYLATQLLAIALEAGVDERAVFFLNYEETLNNLDIEYKGTIIGRYTYGYTNFLSMANALEVKSIGRFCAINVTARFCPNHMYSTVSTYDIWRPPFKNTDKATKLCTNWNNSPKANIGNDVWIGANAVILPHVQIGDGAIIGANAVVAKNVEPYEIVGGSPAKRIRYRFAPEIIEALLGIQWWNWDDEKLRECADDFLLSADQFVNKHVAP